DISGTQLADSVLGVAIDVLHPGLAEDEVASRGHGHRSHGRETIVEIHNSGSAGRVGVAHAACSRWTCWAGRTCWALRAGRTCRSLWSLDTLRTLWSNQLR